MVHQPSFFDEEPKFRRSDIIRFGTSSFSSTDWLGNFYPPKMKPSDFLRYYASQFDTVEIDASYYHVPAPTTVEAWIRKTTDNFKLAAKFPRSIVHGGDTSKPDPRTILQPDATYATRDAFLQVMEPLGARLGPLVLQFPYFSQQGFQDVFFERLDTFLQDLPREFSYAVELRNARWLTDDFFALCRKYQVAATLVDRVHMPHGADLLKKFTAVTAPFSYIRLLGDRREIEKLTQQWQREVIDRAESLSRWAALLRTLHQQKIPTFVFANNHYAGHGPSTIRRLEAMFWERLDADS